MRHLSPVLFAVAMFGAGFASRLLDGWPRNVALGIGLAALAGFLAAALLRGGGAPGRWPGLRPPPTRYGGGTLP